MRITKIAADKLTVKSGRKYFFDTNYPGLALRVSATGGKVWVYTFRIKNGKIIQRRLVLGNYPAVSVEQAHEAWRAASDLVKQGRDPSTVDEKLDPKSAESVIEEWLRLDQGNNKSYDKVEARVRRYIIEPWKDRLISDIDTRRCLAITDAIRANGKHTLANRVHAHLHRFFVWAKRRKIVSENPLEGEERGVEKSRKRFLSDAELLKVWQASEQLLPAYRDAFRLLVLTGARETEIGKLRWDEIRGNEIHLEGERTKNGEPHVIPISRAAGSILKRIARDHDHLFLSERGTPVSHWGRTKQRLDKVSGVTNWRIHDLRRTIAVGLQKRGVPLPVTEAILGHTSGSRSGIIQVYQVYNYAKEKRDALELWGEHVASLVSAEAKQAVA